MRLGIVYDQLIAPIFPGGGGVHSLEVIKRLANDFEIVYFPSSRLFLKWGDRKDEILHKADYIGKIVEIPEIFYEMLDKYSESAYNTFFFEKFSKNMSKIYAKYTKDIEFLYEPDHTTADIFFISKFSGKKFGITLHTPLFYNNNLEYLKELIRIRFNRCLIYNRRGFITSYLYNALYLKRVYTKLLDYSPPSFIASVSEGPLFYSALYKYSIPLRILSPGNAFDSDLLKYRNVLDKADYMIYFGVLAEHKGVLEIPDILYQIRKKVNISLKLLGKFSSRCIEKLFWLKAKNLGVDKNIEFLGFIDKHKEKSKFIDIVSKAKLLLYPSHIDSFSLTILESLALGLPVVSYDIVGIHSIYKNIDAVRLVNEFHKDELAREAVNILQLDRNTYSDLLNNKKIIDFLNFYSSWDNVALEVKKYILEFGKK
ncbi:glycosyltransferase family 4 protein [Acidianus brierleyi]|uniref:glycosyltransferase family 4 protein n=1 Tax=Acidianus brierleyi TaxID=41673 RepID=UPI0013A5B54B|nr:glycosyltransferase family 4 protein [Acidianus brierleyi]